MVNLYRLINLRVKIGRGNMGRCVALSASQRVARESHMRVVRSYGVVTGLNERIHS